MTTLETSRLLIRPWRADEIDHMIQLRGNPRVMTHFTGTDSPQRVREFFPKILKIQTEYGYAFFPVFEKNSGNFCGFCGIQPVPFETRFTPAIEIGWSFLPEFWGKGLATEAASAWLNHAFLRLSLHQIVAFAVRGNIKSHKVMARLNMLRRPDLDFDHPNISPGSHPQLVRHLVWSIDRPQCDEQRTK